MAGSVVKNKGGRPKGSGSPYMQLSKAMAKAFDRSVEKLGGVEAIADLLVEEMRDKNNVLPVLTVIQKYLPRQHNVEMELSASDNLASALSNVQNALELQRSEKAQVIEAEFSEEQSENEKSD
jgi:hypothetical protein